MLSAYLFDQREGREVEGWEDALAGLGKDEVLWLDLQGASEQEANEVGEALGLEDGDVGRDVEEKPAVEQREGHLKMTAIGVAEPKKGASPDEVPITCFIGENWILTVHAADLEVLDDFRKRTAGGGGIGTLDAPSFVALLFGWVVTGYLQAFDMIEVELEEFDVQVLRSAQRDAEEQVGVLVEIRQRVGELRRALALHRDLFSALTDAEFDPLSTEGSAQKFSDLAKKTDVALAAARDAKDSVTGSFDVLIARTEHRTNEIVKILTIASILLLPGALIAGLMGMNVNFKASVFAHSPIFLVVVASIVVIAGATLGIARMRRWI